MSKYQCLYFFSVAIDLIFFHFKLADKKEIHTILDVSNFGQIGRQTTDLPALEYPKIYIYLVVNYSQYFMMYLLSGERSLSSERSLPFGLPVLIRICHFTLFISVLLTFMLCKPMRLRRIIKQFIFDFCYRNSACVVISRDEASLLNCCIVPLTTFIPAG